MGLRFPADQYTMIGHVIHLTHADFACWSQRFHAIPDLRVELEAIDAYIAERPEKYNKDRWFGAVSGMLARRHQEMLAKQQVKVLTRIPRPPEPGETLAREYIAKWVAPFDKLKEDEINALAQQWLSRAAGGDDQRLGEICAWAMTVYLTPPHINRRTLVLHALWSCSPPEVYRDLKLWRDGYPPSSDTPLPGVPLMRWQDAYRAHHAP